MAERVPVNVGSTDALTARGAVFLQLVRQRADPLGDDRFRVIYETIIPYGPAGVGYAFTHSRELSEIEARERLAMAGATDVERLIAEAKADGQSV